MSGKELITTSPHATLPAQISSGNLPAPIKAGIMDLLTAFGGVTHEDADKVRLMRLYGEAIGGMNGAAANYAICWLKFHNPRNPFRPTPQDVYETVERVERTWRERVIGHFTSTQDKRYTEWGTYTLPMPGNKDFDWGPPPLTTGCHVPDSFVENTLREWLDAGSCRVPSLVALGRERLMRIPPQCFCGDQKEQALATIREIEERKAEAERLEAYLATLDPELRKHRSYVLNSGRIPRGAPEEDIIAEARKSLERKQSEIERQRQDDEEQRKRNEAHAQPEVQEAIERLRAAREQGSGREWDKAFSHYIAVMANRGVKPSPHITKPSNMHS